MPLPLIYIHGFGSSGRSAKAHILQAHHPEVYAPTLTHIPELAIDTLDQFIDAIGRPALLVGSSLGGYYAMHLSAKHGLPAVLVNPVIDVDLPLEKYVGLNTSYADGSRFELTTAHLESLRTMKELRPDPSRLLLLVQLGDELLDHRRTIASLEGAEVVAEEGGDHTFKGFDSQVVRILDFGRRQISGA